MPTADPIIRVVVINHENNREAYALACGFRPFASVVMIDSGSRFADGEAAWFDVRLPNVYYSGLVNAAVTACRDLGGADVLYLVGSDVRVPDFGRAIERAALAFTDARVGVYGPVDTGTEWPTLQPRGTTGLRHVPFVEGKCVAARLEILRSMTPIDTRVNALGWGIDVHLAWRARLMRRTCVVDDGIAVTHPVGSGYSWDAARAQMNAWLRTQTPAARRGHRVLFRSFAQTPLGGLGTRIEPWWLHRLAHRLALRGRTQEQRGAETGEDRVR